MFLMILHFSYFLEIRLGAWDFLMCEKRRPWKKSIWTPHIPGRINNFTSSISLHLIYFSVCYLGCNNFLTTVSGGIFEYSHIVALKKIMGTPWHSLAFSWNPRNQGSAYHNFLSTCIWCYLKRYLTQRSKKYFYKQPHGTWTDYYLMYDGLLYITVCLSLFL